MDDLLKLLLKRVDVKGLLLEDLLKGLLEPKLKEFVADSSNPYDDMLLAALLPHLERQLAKLVDDLLAKV